MKDIQVIFGHNIHRLALHLGCKQRQRLLTLLLQQEDLLHLQETGGISRLQS